MLEELGAEDCGGLLAKLLARIRPDLSGGGDTRDDPSGPVKLNSTVIIADSNAEYAKASVELVSCWWWSGGGGGSRPRSSWSGGGGGGGGHRQEQVG